MTQKEAIESALKTLGGRATLQDIYPLAIEMGDFSGSKDKKATIRNCLQRSKKSFRPSPDKPSGWWELLSYQEEISQKDNRIAQLEAEVERLRQIPTEDEFVRRMLEAAKNFYKRDAKELDVIRKIFFAVGRKDAEEELDAWIEGREHKPALNVSGDYVLNKKVDNEVIGVAQGATGVSINKE